MKINYFIRKMIHCVLIQQKYFSDIFCHGLNYNLACTNNISRYL